MYFGWRLMMIMMAKRKRDIPIIKPVHLKFGVALAISFGGIFYTYCRIKKIKSSKSKPSHLSPGSNGNQANSRGQNDDQHDLQTINTDLSSSKEHKHDEHTIDIQSLMSKVKILEEKKNKLELQLLEYYGLEEQATTIMELQKMLRLNNIEAKVYNLKIESLQSENERLETQVANHAKIMNELESAKAKIKLLKKKLRFEAEQNRKHILALQERVMKMQSIDKRDELKEELEEVKKSNKGLETVNSDLATKLEYVQKLATSDLKNEEDLYQAQELKEESNLLQQRNEDLTKEIERLQADHCKDMEELVYLRWVNACFRYELRKSKTVTNKLSPKPEGTSDTDFDPDQCSTSQASSCLTDIGENDDSSIDTIKTTKNSSKKTKVLTKLKKIFSFRAPNMPLQRAASVDDIVGRYSSSDSSRRSLDSRFQDTNSSRRTSDDDSSCFSRRIDSLSPDDNFWSPSSQPREGVKNDMIL